MLTGIYIPAEILCTANLLGQYSTLLMAVLCMCSEQVAQQGEAVRVLQEELTTVKKVVLTMHAGILHAQQHQQQQQQQQQSHHHEHHGAGPAPGQATAPQTPVGMQLPAASETLTPEQPQQQLRYRTREP